MIFSIPIGYDAEDYQIPKTINQISYETAYRLIDNILSNKMSYLDQARRLQLTKTVLEESLACGFDPIFILAISDVESKMNHEAVSLTGARGLYQIVPNTWNFEIKRRGLGRLEKFNASHNAKVGIGHLCYLSKTFKRPDNLLLAYNQGSQRASDIITESAIPSDEASTYSYRVWRSYKILLNSNYIYADIDRMRKLYKSPESTIYALLSGYNGDGHGPRIYKKR